MEWIRLFNHIKNQTQLIVVSSAETYRRWAKELPQPSDTVLEIGCSTGEATKQLALNAKHVVAIDTSFSFVQRCSQDFADLPNISFHHLDARAVSDVVSLLPNPEVIFMDIGGDTPLSNLISLLRQYLLHFLPRAIVVRNFEFSLLSEMVTQVEIPKEDKRVRHLLFAKTQKRDHYLLDLSRSEVLSDRLFAAKKLLEIDAPWAQERIQQLKDDPHPKVRKIPLQSTALQQEIV